MKTKEFPFDSSGPSPYYRALMSVSALPQYIDVQKWADRDAVICQVYPLSGFARLCEGAVGDAGGVKVNVRIHRDEQGLFLMEGQMATTLSLCCQRCLEAVATDIEVEVQLWLLRDEGKAELLAEEADYLVLEEDGRIALADALEDELILALPLVPVHESCEMHQVRSEDIVEADTPRRENPFQVLASLKGSGDKK